MPSLIVKLSFLTRNQHHLSCRKIALHLYRTFHETYFRTHVRGIVLKIEHCTQDFHSHSIVFNNKRSGTIFRNLKITFTRQQHFTHISFKMLWITEGGMMIQPHLTTIWQQYLLGGRAIGLCHYICLSILSLLCFTIPQQCRSRQYGKYYRSCISTPFLPKRMICLMWHGSTCIAMHSFQGILYFPLRHGATL